MGEKPRIDPPGEGPWELDVSHFDRPFPRYGQELYVQGFERGQARWFERVGVPMKGLRLALVHGLPYAQVVPLVGSPKDMLKPPPPKWVLRLVAKLHPQMRRRARAAREWVGGRGWREDVRRWDDEVKPALSARYAALEATDPEALDDLALLAHLEACGAAVVDNFVAHFDTNPTTIYPVGAFLRHASGWTGASVPELLALVSGTGASSPVDASLAALGEALRAGGGVELLEGSPAAILSALRARADAIGEAARAWLALVENRVVASCDFSTPTGGELPGLLCDQIRHAALGEANAPTGRVRDAAAIRERVPEPHRARFDDLLGEARFVYRVRDERSTLLDCWVLGLTRRALVHVGRRLTERGALADFEHVVDLSHDEVAELLRGGDGPGAAEVARRVAARQAMRIEDAPHVLGADAVPPPPAPDALGPDFEELIGALFFYMEHMDKDAPAPAEPQRATLKGLPASGGRYRGPARIVKTPADFAKVQPGDVLVAGATMPAYNVLLPVVGAVVTDRGGALCHAAIVSREYGLPCVVGTREATRALRDGMMVLVDGDRGVVELEVAEAPALVEAARARAPMEVA